MELLEGIFSRRSVRRYTAEPVADHLLREVVRAGCWAPSGLNNQPWRFVVVRDPAIKEALSRLTRYHRIVQAAPVLIAVYCDTSAMYHELKDHLAMGACLQNMLLAAHGLGLGSVWLGEILCNAERVRAVLGLPDGYELMAIVAIGHPVSRGGRRTSRRSIGELVLKEF